MFDLLFTLGILYVGYRGYQWYQGVQQRIRSGSDPNPIQDFDPDGDEDYIDYEEVND